MAFDASGDVYAAVNQTSGFFVSPFFARAYLCKLNGNTGEILWTRQVGGNGTVTTGVAGIDSKGQIALIGYSQDAISGSASVGGTDAFVVTFDDAGNQQWATKVGTAGSDAAFAIKVVGAAVFVGGNTSGILAGARSLSGGAVSANAGGSDAFIAEIRADGFPGSLARILQFGGAGNDSIKAIGARGGGLVAAGETNSLLAAPRLGGGGIDGFVVGLTGVLVSDWGLKQFGGSGYEYVTGVFATNELDVFVAGYTSSSLSSGTNPGGEDAFISKYAADGEFMWDWQSLAVGNERATGFTSNNQWREGPAELYLVGSTSGSSWPSASIGGSDGFMISLEGY